MTTFTNKNNDRHKYCPKYDTFLPKMRQELKERLTKHSNLREPMIKRAVKKTIEEILRLGYRTNTNIIEYNQSFVNHTEINTLIDDWQGPIISTKYKEKFNNGEVGEIDYKKFSKDSVNWLDQSSYKVTGPFFFAPHLKAVRRYLINFIDTIINIQHNANINKEDLINYSCIYFAFQVLNTKTKFHRSKQQPLIRHKTLVNCKKLQDAFHQLHDQFDLDTFKKTVKKNQKAKKEKEKLAEAESNSNEGNKKGKGRGSKYRLNAAAFYNNFADLCQRLLSQEKQIKFGERLEIAMDCNSDEGGNILPVYFQDAQPETTTSSRMDIDSPDSDTISNSSMTSVSIPPPVTTNLNNQPPKPGLPVISPPLRPPLPPKEEKINDNEYENQQQQQPIPMQFNHGYQLPPNINCACDEDYISMKVPPIPVQIGSRTVQALPSTQQNMVYVPMIITENGQGQFIGHPQMPPIPPIPQIQVRPPTLPPPIQFPVPLSLPRGYNGNRGGPHYRSALRARHAPYFAPPIPQLPPTFTGLEAPLQIPRPQPRYEPQPGYPMGPATEYEMQAPQSPTHSVHSSNSSHSSHSNSSHSSHSHSTRSEYSQHHTAPMSSELPQSPRAHVVESAPFINIPIRESSITAPTMPFSNIDMNQYPNPITNNSSQYDISYGHNQQ